MADAGDGAVEQEARALESCGSPKRRRPSRRRARAEGEDVAQDAADARRRALEGFDGRGVVVALHLEGGDPAVGGLHGAPRSRPGRARGRRSWWAACQAASWSACRRSARSTSARTSRAPPAWARGPSSSVTSAYSSGVRPSATACSWPGGCPRARRPPGPAGTGERRGLGHRPGCYRRRLRRQVRGGCPCSAGKPAARVTPRLRRPTRRWRRGAGRRLSRGGCRRHARGAA